VPDQQCLGLLDARRLAAGPPRFGRVAERADLGVDLPQALRQAIDCCRKGGTASVPGVYLGYIDKSPAGTLVNEGLTLKTSQTHVIRYLEPLTHRTLRGEIDPT
jgi:threonine dehydrogenase-like Zn-dependent dehydrogenase